MSTLFCVAVPPILLLLLARYKFAHYHPTKTYFRCPLILLPEGGHRFVVVVNSQDIFYMMQAAMIL